MKPLKLKINAFGPYASYEEVDFTKLDSIYLVTGPTGAGKTSIFDALCFALFGETSGKTREQRDLKSDFASEDEVTYVELEFLLHGESYTIRREPTQSMKGRKTLRGHNVELHLPDEKLITKVADVKDKIEELLGLNIEQFRQIVMLPQGEFRKLIESSTEEKEKIFRKIFSSEVYKNFSDKLKEKSMAMRRDVEKSLDRRKTLLKKIEPGENKKLRELLVLDNMNVLQVIEETNSQVNEDIKVLMELDSKQRENNIIIENNTRAIEKALEINLKIDNILKLKEEIEDLKSREDEIKGIELKSNKAKCAQGILAHENNFNEAKKILERKSEDVIRAGLSFESAKNILKIAKEKLERANRKDSEKKSLEKLLHTLESKVNDFKKYEEDKKQYNNKKISLDKTEISITEGLDNIRSNKLAVNEIEEYIEKIKGIDGEIVLLETTNRDNESDVLYLREFYVRLTNFKKLIENHRKLSLDYDDISRVYLDKNNYYEEKSEELKKEQAGILALKLVEGDECPVCGSINHPKKAISSASHLSELQMKKLKEELEGIKKDKEQKLNEASIALAKIQEMETGTISDGMKKLLPHIEFSRDKVPEILGEAENKGKLLRDELSIIVATLNEKRRLQGIREEKKQVREKLLKEIDALDINIKILENDKLEYFGKCEALKESINEFEKSKGEGISSLIQLEEKISNISIQVTSIEDEIIGAQRYEKEADGNMHSESKNIENKTYEENEARNILNERTKTFYERLSEDNISYEEYNKSKLELHEIKLL
ncbi:MAG: hypothetical protein RR645_00620, partial [Clostridium sp.]